MEVKNGRIVKDTINKEDKYIGENIVSQVNNTIFSILNGKKIYDFEIKMLKTTIHLLYLQNPHIALRDIEYVSNINCESFKNYTCDINDISDSTIESISNKIANEIYDALKNSYCYFPQPLKRHKEEISFGIKLFEEIYNKRISIIGKMEKPKNLCGIYYPISAHTKPYFGNETIRVSIGDGETPEFDGDNEYVELYNNIYKYESAVEIGVEKFSEFEKNERGNFRIKDGKMYFVIKDSKKYVSNVNDIMTLIKENIRFDDELEETRKLVKEIREEEKRKEEERQQKITQLRKEIYKQPICKDIYTLIKQSSPQTAPSIANFLTGKKDSGYVNGPEYYGKWNHYSMTEIKNLIKKMAESELLSTEEAYSYRYGDFILYKVKDEYADNEEVKELTEDMHLSDDELNKITKLVDEVINGQNAMMQLISIIVQDRVYDTKTIIKEELKKRNYDTNLYMNKIIQELVED